MVDRLIFGWIPGLDRREGYGVEAKLRSLIRRACYELYRSWVSLVSINVRTPYRKQNRQSQLSLHQFIKQGFCSCFVGDRPFFASLLRLTKYKCILSVVGNLSKLAAWLAVFRSSLDIYSTQDSIIVENYFNQR